MKFSLKTLIWLTMLIAIALAAAFTLVPKPIAVEFATASMGPLRVTVQEDGKTRIREKYIVSAPVSGRISRIELKAGDYCDGETLLLVILPSDPAILDSRARAEASAKVQAAEATLQRARSNAEQAVINHDLSQSKLVRADALLESRAVSREEYDVVKAEQLVTAQGVETAKFDTEIAKYELEMAKAAAAQFSDSQPESSAKPFEIFSPIRGRVLRVFEESSTVVNVGEPLVELGDPSNLEMEIDVLSTDAVRISPGAPVTVEHWGGEQPLKGNVRVIEPAAFTKISSLGVEEQRVNIIADFDEPAERIASLGDGYRIEARITIDEVKSTLQIPNSALFRHNRQWHVLSIIDGNAQLQRVTLGMQSESESEIIDGLKAGDRVIVYPSDQLKPGTAVKPVP